MKAKTINLQLVKNVGNYESVRLGGEWSLDKDEDMNKAMTKAYDELNEAFAILMQQKQDAAQVSEEEQAKAEANASGKEFLQWGTPKHQQVVQAVMEGRANLDKVKEFYTFTSETEKVINFAVAMCMAKIH